jgi:phosphoribosylformylglycinamidine cyclo-ligase
MAHITGGGITENLPRILPHSTAAIVNTASWEVPPVFRWLQASGRVPADEMLRTFNMGIGLILVVGHDRADAALEELAARGGRDARVIGEVVAGETPTVTYT